MNSILDKNLVLKGKKVIVRVDLNVPMKNGSITEVSRIIKVLPTLKLLIEKEAKIIILSHIGRPKGKVVNGMSLEPISKKLADLLNVEVLFNKNEINEKTLVEINKIPNGSVMMMENIRFYEKEEQNDYSFSKKISNLGDIYVNDAFSCSHRAHSSIEGITKYIPSYCGLQFLEEINALKKITSEIIKPVTCIIGGSKISTKIKIISNLIKIFDNIIIIGGMGNAMLKNTGINIGKSVCDDGYKNLVGEILEKSKTYNCSIYYPLDVVDMPNMTEGKKNKKQVNGAQLFNEIFLRTKDIQKEDIKVIIEQVSAMPGQGVTSMFNFGQSVGVLKGICSAMRLPMYFVRAAKWKKYFNLINSEKDASRTKTIEIFPYFSSQLTRKKDGNKADAILIASFFYETYRSEE